MTAILRNLPFHKDRDEVAFGSERIPIKPYQIIAWFSLTARSVVDVPPQASRFPAILDIGHNHNFSIQHRHLVEWAGLPADGLPSIGHIRERERLVPLCAANVWIHPNVPDKRDQLKLDSPFLLRLDQGIAIYPSDGDFPRLPLLGLRGLVRKQTAFNRGSRTMCRQLADAGLAYQTSTVAGLAFLTANGWCNVLAAGN